MPYLLVQSDGDLRIKFTVGQPADNSTTVQIVPGTQPDLTIDDSFVNNTDTTAAEDESSN